VPTYIGGHSGPPYFIVCSHLWAKVSFLGSNWQLFRQRWG